MKQTNVVEMFLAMLFAPFISITAVAILTLIIPELVKRFLKRKPVGYGVAFLIALGFWVVVLGIAHTILALMH